MRSTFEQYLISKGFKPDSDKLHYSSLDHIHTCYQLGDVKFYFGLSEKDKPPTLIYPRPRAKSQIYVDDNLMNRMLMKYDSETIFNACLYQSIRLEI